MSFLEKTYFARVYRPTVSGTTTSGLVSTIKDFVFTGFQARLNEGLGECRIQLPRSVSSFGEGSDIAMYNQFDIFVQDKEAPSTGEKVYSGYVVEYTPTLQGTDEYLDVTLWGYGTEFSQKILETASGTTLAYYSVDPSVILQDVFNRYDGKIGASIAFSPSETFSSTVNLDTVATTGTWSTADRQARIRYDFQIDDFTTTALRDGANTTASWGPSGLTVPNQATTQQQLTANVSEGLDAGNTNDQGFAQSFTPAEAVTMTGFTFKGLRDSGSSFVTLTWSVQTDSAGSPSGSVVGGATGTVTLTTSQQTFSPSFSITLSAGTTYWLVGRCAGYVGSTGFQWYVQGNTAGGYSGGLSKKLGAFAAWVSTTSAADIYFTTTLTNYNAAKVGQSVKLNSFTDTITKILLNVNSTIPAGSITYQVSANGGASWETPSTGTVYTLVTPGNDLRFRATVTGTAASTPTLNRYDVTMYARTGDIVQSLGYDTACTSVIYAATNVTKTTPGGTTVTTEYSDSADNVVFGSWTTDITSLNKRYVRFRLTLATADVSITPSVSSLLFSAQSASIATTNTVVSYAFRQNTIREAIDQCVKLAPAYYYWRVAADNQFIFAQRNTNVIDHTLILQRDISKFQITRSAKSLRNSFYFLGGANTFTKTERTSSKAQYGKRVERQQDERVTDNNSAGIIARTFLDLYDHPVIVGEITVVDSNGDDNSGYDIEKFRVGQIVKIVDPTRPAEQSLWDQMVWDVSSWDFPITAAIGAPLWIVSIDYSLDRAVLELAFQPPDVAKRIEDINRNLVQTRTANSPASPASV